MTNKQIVDKILETLEKEHINLYHDIPKEEIKTYIAGIEGLNKMTDSQFDLEMLKLFALFKDAHTSYRVQYIPVDKKLTYINGKFYVLDNDKWKEISYFGKLKASEMYKQLEPLINYETQEWLNQNIKNMVNNGYIYKLLELNDADKLELTLVDGTKLELHKQNTTNFKSDRPKVPYSFKLINNNILYFKYERCCEDKEYPFSEFLKEITETIEENKISEYILDLRGNTGGNSEILNPFQKLVNDKNLNGVLLIDNGVFSSGRFAVARFKKEFNTPLIGEPTGGAAKSYGYTKPLEVEGKRFSASIRLWDFSKFFGYEGAIQPDILVKESIEDIQNQEDIILKTAVDYINKSKNNHNSLDLSH